MLSPMVLNPSLFSPRTARLPTTIKIQRSNRSRKSQPAPPLLKQRKLLVEQHPSRREWRSLPPNSARFVRSS